MTLSMKNIVATVKDAFSSLSQRRAMKALNSFIDDDGYLVAGHLSFTAFLSLFPFVIFVAALAGLLGNQETAEVATDYMFRFMPGDVAEVLAPPVKEVITTRSGGLLTLGVFGTIWTASGGIEAIRLSLNRAYNATEDRPFWWRRLQSAALVVAAAFAVFALAITVILGPVVWNVADSIVRIPDALRPVWIALRYSIALVLLIGGLIVLHRWLPDRTMSVRFVFPGVVLTAILWLIGGTAFSIYLGTVAQYSVVYGSLGGVIIALLFFYISGAIFVLGAEFNAVKAREEGQPVAQSDKPL